MVSMQKMEDISSGVAVSNNRFDSMCRTCLCDLKGASITFNVENLFVQKREDTKGPTELLAIKEVLAKCTAIQASRKFCKLLK